MAQLPGRMGNIGRSLGNAGKGGKTDSLKHRTNAEDSITLYFRYLDSSRNYRLDSSVSDFTRYFPVPATYITLGNDGAAAKSLLFSPMMKSGWDPGFHAFDIYKFKMERVRFLNTTRPYTELNYLIGSRSEQIIEVFHTQNIKPNWNASFNYRLIGSPGFFKNFKANHNNYLLTSWYQGKNKRYNNYFVVLANVLKPSENGGFVNGQQDLNDLVTYKDRFGIPTRLGGDQAYSPNFLNTSVITGHQYNEATFLMRQQYDFGRKDSVVTDSTVIPLFYPRLRFEHTFSYTKYRYEFHDQVTDTNYYKTYYNYDIPNGDTALFKDTWKEMLNDFSIYQFPDANNLQQFIKLGASVQNLKGDFYNNLDTNSTSIYNIFAHAEYRNRTRDRKWDIEANGKLYLGGFNAGDYQAHISLQRLIGKKIGYLQVGFENVNRSPSYIYDNKSSYHVDTAAKSFNKENIVHFFASFFNPALNLKLTGDYYLVSNYMYLTSYYKLQQESALFNFLQLSLQKRFQIGKHWYWYTDVYLQQKAGDVALNVPLIFTRNRLALEGNFYRNLNISTGIEVRYNSAYKADAYSPVLGSFMYQDSTKINNRPDIRLFLNFRIRSFRLFISIANLNAINVSSGLSFTNNYIPAQDYAYPGMQLRFGIYWDFVN